DKTGTLTYGLPHLEEIVPAPGFEKDEVLRFAAALERYSRHPLASAILGASQERGWTLWEVSEASEAPGAGLRGTVLGRTVWITGRGKLGDRISGRDLLPPVAGGLECVVVLDGRYAGLLRFRDAPRTESRRFVGHLGPRHQFSKLIILSGDREEEVRRLAGEVGIDEVHAEKTPEEKLAIVRRETERTGTLYVGDGVNDAPAMMAATVGVAVGRNSDVAAEAAAAVVLDGSLERVDEFLHIGRRTLRIAVQTAVGGMTLSLAGMAFAVGGYLNPVEGAIFQEVIDVLAIFNALRTVAKPRFVSDC
ncbi:MAG TPA: HAD-IC family P-type ATPase, partial [Candidatus Methylacidiphilales bacterium]